jgi:cellulose synthase/poly-beta-1,6-N-acetylglucosamine synthase-like glycosyltransferase
MITIIITAWEEPKATQECIKRFLVQKIPDRFEIWVTCPDEPTKKVVMDYKKKYKNIHFLHQPRELGKNVMMNLLSKKAKGTILIFTDGDIFVAPNSVKELYDKFKDPKVGCVSGRPVSANPKDNMLGYWSHLLTDAGAHRIRMEKYKYGEFLECTGYLFAMRKGVIDDIPEDVAEDAIIPYMFWQKGYKIAYADKALAYVTYPKNFNDWVNQKVRSGKAHEMLDKYMDRNNLRVKSFGNEALNGLRWAFLYPKTMKEFFWTLLLFPARLYVWTKYAYETKMLNSHYGDKWKRVQSTRPLDHL